MATAYPSSRAPASAQPRRPSGARPSPSMNPNNNNPQPVRAEYFNPPQSHRPTPPHSLSQRTPPHQQPNSKPFLPPMVHRPSMPSPKSTLIPSAHQLGGHSGASSISSRPSPLLSSHSEDSLRETTRHNIPSNAPYSPQHIKHSDAGPRGNLPSARQASANLLWGDVKSPKSPEITTPKESYVAQIDHRNEVDINFDNLMDSLQVPLSVREKFATVSPAVKRSILSSAGSSNPAILSHLGLPLPSASGAMPKIKKRLSTPLLRKAKSSSSLTGGQASPGSSPQVGKTYRVDGESFTIVASPLQSTSATIPTHPLPHAPTRGQSMDIPRPAVNRLSTGPGSSRPLSGFFSPSSLSRSTAGRSTGLGINLGEQPESFISWLQSYKATDLAMDVGRMKKLRMLLRHENTAWVDHFLRLGGYNLILARLKEMVDVEWREEQHDDQMLYELLRCVKALGTSEVGKAALRYHYPDPFPSLSTLIFSEKKPGDLPSRQLIIELWLFLFDLFPSSPVSSPTHASASASASRPTSVRFDANAQPLSQFMAGGSGGAGGLGAGGRGKRIIKAHEEVKGLLIPDISDSTVDVHEFVKVAHRPRVFKVWMGELSDICRDYFWIMCHGSNPLWAADEVDERLVEKPVAPGGATGGVEFEAMNYMTVHLKLLNRLCKQTAEQDREAAAELHRDLFQSGMDRILVTLRKASTTFYPALHLELARYVHHLQIASPNARLPHLIDKMVGSPPEMYQRRRAQRDMLPPPTPPSAASSSRPQSGPKRQGSTPVSVPQHIDQKYGQRQEERRQPQPQPQQQAQGDQGSGTRAWLEDARKGGKVGDGGRRGGWDLEV